jgi:hypothetical protein
MRPAFAAAGLAVMLVLAGCATTPADTPFAPGDVTVDIVDREADTGRIRIALENNTRERLGYLWYLVSGDKAPVAGTRQSYFDAGGFPHQVTLGPGRRQIVAIDCPGDGFCRYVDDHVGLHVCRAPRGDECRDFEVVWSPTTIAQAPGGVAVFDVHLHGGPDPVARLAAARAAGVGSIALSTSWEDQQAYLDQPGYDVLPGLMFPCPRGKVPYSGQSCFADGREWPGIEWVEAQVAGERVRFLGEILTQYYGIAPDDPRMEPYWALAEKHRLPVGIHTGSAGPDHGSPDFREELGNPALLRPVLAKHPTLRLWLMHAGGPYLDEAIALMRDHPGVHADLSAIADPRILPPERFAATVQALLAAGLGERIMFGSDNGDIPTLRASLDGLPLTDAQRRGILHDNAARFFERRKP